jgi:serine/threonine-protein kinase
MLTRLPPFTATNEMDLLIKVRDAKYRPIHELQPEVPPELAAITDKCLTRSRANRYQTAAEAEGDLRAFLRKFMPNYSRSHLGRYIRKTFATEIERELRMLEEYVLADAPSDDVGESLMVRDADFEPPEVPFQPKPTSVSVALPPNDFSGDSNFTTVPKVEERVDIHVQATQILEDRGRRAPSRAPSPHVIPRKSTQMARATADPAPRSPTQPPRSTTQPPTGRPRGPTQPPPARTPRGATQPPPIPPQGRRAAVTPAVKPVFDDDLHGAPTMIIDINRMRRRRPG